MTVSSKTRKWAHIDELTCPHGIFSMLFALFWSGIFQIFILSTTLLKKRGEKNKIGRGSTARLAHYSSDQFLLFQRITHLNLVCRLLSVPLYRWAQRNWNIHGMACHLLSTHGIYFTLLLIFFFFNRTRFRGSHNCHQKCIACMLSNHMIAYDLSVFAMPHKQMYVYVQYKKANEDDCNAKPTPNRKANDLIPIIKCN